MGFILLGYRGSGKTSVGRELARRLREDFLDTDELIIATAKKTIREIFEQDGETAFRDLETAAVRLACAKTNAVIGLGGGAILREENRTILTAAPHRRVYLRCDATELHRRIHSDPATAANRPSLTHLGGGIEEIQLLLEKREPLYRAVMTDELEVTGLSVKDIVEKLLKV